MVFVPGPFSVGCTVISRSVADFSHRALVQTLQVLLELPNADSNTARSKDWLRTPK